jgi:hypothetical protein
MSFQLVEMEHKELGGVYTIGWTGLTQRAWQGTQHAGNNINYGASAGKSISRPPSLCSQAQTVSILTGDVQRLISKQAILLVTDHSKSLLYQGKISRDSSNNIIC